VIGKFILFRFSNTIIIKSIKNFEAKLKKNDLNIKFSNYINIITKITINKQQ
jgi:hypothetical protein